MASEFTELVIDCADPRGLARFWCDVLGYEIRYEDDDAVTIGPPGVHEGEERPGPVPPMSTFLRVPEGKTVKNRLHLDLRPTDRSRDEEVRRLLDLGLDTSTSARATMSVGSSSPTRRAMSSASWPDADLELRAGSMCVHPVGSGWSGHPVE